MKPRSVGLALVVCLTALWACRDSRPQDVNNPLLHVVAAETFLADIAQNVAKDRVHIEALMPAGVDPHEYQPTPADVRKVAQCQLLILNGAGLEEFQKELLRNAGGNPIVTEAAKGLTLRVPREGEIAEMTAAEAADAILAAAADQKPKSVAAMKFASSANSLAAGSKLFDVRLTTLDDGSLGGSVAYQAAEGGIFQIATGTGEVQVLKSPGPGAVAPQKSFPLTGDTLTRGYTVELDRGAQYVLTLRGFKAASTALLIAPAADSHGTGDPHAWMDPNNAITYVINIRDGLSMADPFWAATYKKNADDYILQLRNLDAEIKRQVQEIPQDRRVLVTNHDSLGYFADRYGFRVIGTIVPSVSSDASPSPKQLARLVDRIRATHAPAIFLEADTNAQLARQMARETGVKVVTDLHVHSTSAAGGPAPTYVQMIRYDAKLIVDALKAK